MKFNIINSLPNQRFHVGVYGVLINENKALLIKKSRGDYKGMSDLPGGSIEFGEKVEDALKREFIEETGVILKDYDFLGHNEYFCDYLNELSGSRQLHHFGLYYSVSTSLNKIKTDAYGQDSLGAEFIDIKDLDKIEISPIARPMIEKVINKSI